MASRSRPARRLTRSTCRRRRSRAAPRCGPGPAWPRSRPPPRRCSSSGPAPGRPGRPRPARPARCRRRCPSRGRGRPGRARPPAGRRSPRPGRAAAPPGAGWRHDRGPRPPAPGRRWRPGPARRPPTRGPAGHRRAPGEHAVDAAVAQRHPVADRRQPGDARPGQVAQAAGGLGEQLALAGRDQVAPRWAASTRPGRWPVAAQGANRSAKAPSQPSGARSMAPAWAAGRAVAPELPRLDRWRGPRSGCGRRSRHSRTQPEEEPR